eukprot:Skav214265  [mRNA]  locus=scaffold1877:122130:143624:+ [translate_table: standard]
MSKSTGDTRMALRFCYARFARCRNSHLSAWSRNVNFQLHRGIASATLRAAETRPQNGWAEQRMGSCLGPATGHGETSLENAGSAASEAVAAILCTIMEMDAVLAGRCSEYLDLSVLGHQTLPGRRVDPQMRRLPKMGLGWASARAKADSSLYDTWLGPWKHRWLGPWFSAPPSRLRRAPVLLARPRATVPWHRGASASGSAAGRVAPQRGAARGIAMGALCHGAVAMAGGLGPGWSRVVVSLRWWKASSRGAKW